MQLSMRQYYLAKKLQTERFGEIAVPVDPERILLHHEATTVVRSAADQVASESAVTREEIISRLFDNVFRLEPSDTLMLLIELPRHDIEFYVELPSAMWNFR
jgi:hypothetical protein